MKYSTYSLLVVTLLSLLILGSGAFTARQAHAATIHVQMAASPTCSQDGCNGYDPYDTGCAGNDASYRVVDSVPLYDWSRARVGYLQLWYSDTCRTNWARFTCTTYTSHCPIFFNLYLREESTPGCQCGQDVQWGNSGENTEMHTKQQYLPTVRALADIQAECSNVGCIASETHWE